MAGTIHDDDDELIAGINVTPLVDVVLVLLIIFIVTASSLLRSSIPIELPTAQTSESSGPGPMVVGIGKEEGQLTIDAVTSKLDDIPTAVAAARRRMSDPKRELTVFISAHVEADYGRFAAVVDRLRLAGVSEIAMDTRPVAEEEPVP